MNCPDCQGKLSRKQTFDRGSYVERINQCQACSRRITTREYAESYLMAQEMEIRCKLSASRNDLAEIKQKHNALLEALKTIGKLVNESE